MLRVQAINQSLHVLCRIFQRLARREVNNCDMNSCLAVAPLTESSCFPHFVSYVFVPLCVYVLVLSVPASKNIFNPVLSLNIDSK